jgi:hypothetical protein
MGRIQRTVRDAREANKQLRNYFERGEIANMLSHWKTNPHSMDYLTLEEIARYHSTIIDVAGRKVGKAFRTSAIARLENLGKCLSGQEILHLMVGQSRYHSMMKSKGYSHILYVEEGGRGKRMGSI